MSPLGKLRPGQQPQHPVKINWSHPLANGLCFFAFGDRNYVDDTPGTPLSTNAARTRNANGRAYESNSTTDGGWHFEAPSVQRLNNGTKHTIGGSVAIDSGTTWGKFIGSPASKTTWASPYVQFTLNRNSSSDFWKLEWKAVGGANVGPAFSASPTYLDASDRVIMATRNGATAKIFEDGLLRLTEAAAPTNAMDVSQNTGIYLLSRNDVADGEGSDGRVSWSAVWNRELSEAEVRLISLDPYQIFVPVQSRQIFVSSVTLSYLRPASDAVDGGWTDQVGGTSLFAAIDEVTASDADYCTTADGATADIFRVNLSGGNVDTAQAVTVRYRYGKSGTQATNITVRLKEGVTVIATWAHTGVADGYTDAAQVLTAPQKAAVSSWSALSLEFEANP